MIWLYRALLNLAIPFAVSSLVFRGFKNRAYWGRWKERFGFVSEAVKQANGFDLWIHAVSVGRQQAPRWWKCCCTIK